MIDYEILRLVWWVLLGVLLIGFAVMDGFDLGVGALLPFLGKNDDERRVIINTVAPVWEGNQVWLLLGGGAVFAAWPALYAVAFSGFYLAMFLVLSTLILRPVAFKFRSKVEDPRWRAFWDWSLFVSGAVPPVIFGVAVGNALLGVPFTFDDTMRMTYTGSLFDLLNPFGLLSGLVSLAMLIAQGASWLVLKTEGAVQTRARRALVIAAPVALLLFLGAGVWIASGFEGYRITSAIDPNGPSNPLLKTVVKESGAWLANYSRLPLSMAVPALAILGTVLTLGFTAAKRPLAAFVGNSLTVAGIIGTAGVSMFPFLLPSSLNPSASLTVWDASSSASTLTLMAGVSIVFMPIVLAYTSWVYSILRGKVTEAFIREQNKTAY